MEIDGDDEALKILADLVAVMRQRGVRQGLEAVGNLLTEMGATATVTDNFGVA